MRGPYGLELNEGCKTCKLRGVASFCQLASAAARDFDAIKITATYPKGAILFIEKQDPRGVFVLCQGEAKLSISSSEGKTLVIRIANAGEILGLVSALSGSPYEVTAETTYPSQVAFVRRDDFLRFIAKYPEATQNVTRQMSEEYRSACEQLRTVGLSSSVQEKLARLLLTWSTDKQETKDGVRLTLPLTHEEIAEFVGTTRESVTRTLSEFKHRRLITLHGSTLMIPNRAALQSFVGT